MSTSTPRCVLTCCVAEHDWGDTNCVVDVAPVPVLGDGEPVLVSAHRDLRGSYIELDVDNRTARVLLTDLTAAVTAAGAVLEGAVHGHP